MKHIKASQWAFFAAMAVLIVPMVAAVIALSFTYPTFGIVLGWAALSIGLFSLVEYLERSGK